MTVKDFIANIAKKKTADNYLIVVENPLMRTLFLSDKNKNYTYSDRKITFKNESVIYVVAKNETRILQGIEFKESLFTNYSLITSDVFNMIISDFSTREEYEKTTIIKSLN